jgi:hypothetical protein
MADNIAIRNIRSAVPRSNLRLNARIATLGPSLEVVCSAAGGAA